MVRNALLLYPDRPFRVGTLYGWEFNPGTQRREKFLIAEPRDLSAQQVHWKERRLVEAVKAELAHGRRCQIYAVYTQKRDEAPCHENEGIQVAVLTTDVPPESREAWYGRHLCRAQKRVIKRVPEITIRAMQKVEDLCNQYATGEKVQ